jgi:CheY-like chemotaxis protein
MGIIDQAFLLMCLVVPMAFFWDKHRIKRILIVEDSPSDIMLFKINVHVENCVVEYSNSAEGIISTFWRRKPDLVIIEYFLSGKQKGDELLRFCDNNKIPAFLVTGNEGEILGVENHRIVRKSADRSYYQQLESLIQKAIT